MKNLVLSILLLLALGSPILAQDMHLSQFWSTRSFLNPAMCGSIQEDYQVTLIHRNQWAAVGAPYKNSFFTAELPFLRKRGNPNHFGTGLTIYQSTAGTSVFKTFGAEGHIAWHQSVGIHDKLSVGISAAMIQRSINLDGLLWDSQFNGAGVDPSLGSGEDFASQADIVPDGSLGLYWQHAAFRQFSIGYSVKHFLQNQSFLASSSDQYSTRQSLFGEWKQDVGPVELVGRGLFQLQSKIYEGVFGVYASMQLGSDSRYTTNKTSSKVIGGAAYRWGDAIMTTIGYEFKHRFTCLLSYDLNSSRLKQSTNRRGAWEIGLAFAGWTTSQRRKLTK